MSAIADEDEQPDVLVAGGSQGVDGQATLPEIEDSSEGSEGDPPPVWPAAARDVDPADEVDGVRVVAVPHWLFDLALAAPHPKLRPAAAHQDEKPPSRPPESEIPMSKAKRLALATAYVAKMPEAVSERGGHNATIAAAVAMIRGFSLDYQDAGVVDAFKRTYNERCQPRWNDTQVAHKLESAAAEGLLDWGARLPFPTYEVLHARATQVAHLLPISPYQDHLHLLSCLDSRARAAAHNGHDPAKLAFAEDLDTRLAHAVVRQFGSEQLYVDLLTTVNAGAFARAQPDPQKYLRGKYAEGLLRFADDMTTLTRVRFFAADVSRTKFNRRDVAQVSATLYLVPTSSGPRFEHRVAIRLGQPAAGELSGEWEETLAALPRERFLRRAEETLVEREAEIEDVGTPFRYARVGGLRSEALAVVKTSPKTGKLGVKYLLPVSFEATATAISAASAAPVSRAAAATATFTPSSNASAPTAASMTAAILSSTKGTTP